MKMESFIKSKMFVFAAGMIIGLALVKVFLADNTQDRIASERLSLETTADSLAESLNAQDESIREIRGHLVALEEKLSLQLSDTEMISQQNMNDISELWKLKEGFDDGDIVHNASDNSAKNINIDPDRKQEQAALESESKEAEYERQLEDYFYSQQEDMSWSVQVESDFQSAFDNYVNQIQLNSVSCRDAMCKVSAKMMEVGNVSAEQLPQLDHIIHGDANWQGKSMFKMDLESGEITLYLIRDGVDFPLDKS